MRSPDRPECCLKQMCDTIEICLSFNLTIRQLAEVFLSLSGTINGRFTLSHLGKTGNKRTRLILDGLSSFMVIARQND
jgi:hypothetical protein